MILTQSSDRKQTMPEESITVLGKHLELLEEPQAWLPLAPFISELFTPYKYMELCLLSAVKLSPLRENITVN